MPSVTPFVVGVAATLLLASYPPDNTTSAKMVPAPPVQVVCGADAAFCGALTAEIEVLAPGQDVRLMRQEGPLEGRAVLTVRYVPEAESSSSLTGHLSWVTPDGAAGRGPSLQLSVMDAQLAPSLLRSFAQQLIRFSSLPL